MSDIQAVITVNDVVVATVELTIGVDEHPDLSNILMKSEDVAIRLNPGDIMKVYVGGDLNTGVTWTDLTVIAHFGYDWPLPARRSTIVPGATQKDVRNG